MSHEHLMERLRAAIRLPGNLQKSCKFFCRGLDIRVPQVRYSAGFEASQIQCNIWDMTTFSFDLYVVSETVDDTIIS